MKYIGLYPGVTKITTVIVYAGAPVKILRLPTTNLLDREYFQK